MKEEQPTRSPIDEEIARLRAELEQVRRERDELGKQLEHDRVTVASGVVKVHDALHSREWLREGRGPYEWNDDNWFKEFSAAYVEFEEALKPLAKIGADWSNCSRDPRIIADARIDLRKRAEASESREKRVREALEKLIAWLDKRSVLSGPQWAYLELLINLRRKPLTLERLAEQFNTTVRARGFEENIRFLRNNEMIVTTGGTVVAADWLFV